MLLWLSAERLQQVSIVRLNCPLIDVVMGRSLQNLVEIEGWIVGQFIDGRNFQRHFTRDASRYSMIARNDVGERTVKRTYSELRGDRWLFAISGWADRLGGGDTNTLLRNKR